MAYTLVLLRHGESEWNKKNLFVGWVDVSSSEKGVEEAKHIGKFLRENDVLLDPFSTSPLRRVINTAYYTLDAADRLWVPVERSWRFGERHYGVLQGKNKKEARDGYGEEQFTPWCRSSDIAPPATKADTKFSQDSDPCYLGEVPASECPKDVVARFMPYWESTLASAIKIGKTVIIGAHGDSLRALVEYLDNTSDEDITGANIPTGIPFIYEFDEETLKPVGKGGTYLDPEAETKIAIVASQGK